MLSQRKCPHRYFNMEKKKGEFATEANSRVPNKSYWEHKNSRIYYTHVFFKLFFQYKSHIMVFQMLENGLGRFCYSGLPLGSIHSCSSTLFSLFYRHKLEVNWTFKSHLRRGERDCRAPKALSSPVSGCPRESPSRKSTSSVKKR